MAGLIKLLSTNFSDSTLSLIFKFFKLINFKFEQPENIYFISVTLEKTKLDKSIVFNDIHLVNIDDIDLTF